MKPEDIVNLFNYDLKPNNLSLACRKLAYGVGINDASYITNQEIEGKRVKCPFYDRWINMLVRCYSPKYQEKQPTYKGCSVSDEWLFFSNFKAWMESQDWAGKQLDKDLLFSGNKIYSSDRCIFVTQEINTLFCDNAASRGDCPIGVNWHKNENIFRANISVYGRKQHLGCFKTIDEASEAYREAKIDYVAEVALKQTGKLKIALINRVNEMINVEWIG